jgi:hypothetical protein
VERDKPKLSESVGQTLPQLPWKQKMGDLKNVWIPFIKLHDMLVLPIPTFLAYLVPLDVDVTGNITAKISEVWSELNFFKKAGFKKCLDSFHQTS